MALTGRGIEPNRDEAYSLFKKAAAAGNEQAKAALSEVQGMDN